jgi:hypothetical protein
MFGRKSDPFSNGESDLDSEGKIVDLENILDRAEEKAAPEGKTVLSTGRSMIQKKKIIKGSCWDYANAVYNKAGFRPSDRITPLKSKMNGPYADLSSIQAGDWLYFINHSFKETDHSGIFVEWTDYENQRAVILSYVGGRKKKPGNYKIYNLRHVYYIIRPK